MCLTIDELSDEVVARTGPWAGDLVMPAFQGMWPRWRQVMLPHGPKGMGGPPRRARRELCASAPIGDGR